MGIALITGASSGLGRELSLLVDSLAFIDEIWLVSRRAQRLEELSALLKKQTKIIALDLEKTDFTATISTLLERKKQLNPDFNVSLLINCAGFGKIGEYNQISFDENSSMISLNCTAPVNMTVSVLPYMDKGSRIMQVSSTSAFQPCSGLAVYAATKAFLLSYSRALRAELKPKKISVTAVCPYWIKDTEFISIANGEKCDRKAAFSNFLFASKVQTVAKRSLKAALKRKAVCTPGFVCSFHRFCMKILPKSVAMAFWECWRHR